MLAALIVVHLLIAIALVVLVLLQRSEGGALGIGGGGSFMSGRGAADALTKATSILGGLFMATSIGLAIVANLNKAPSSIMDVPVAPVTGAPSAPAQPAVPAPPAAPSVPQNP